MVSVEAKKDLLGPLALTCAGAALFIYALGRRMERERHGEQPTFIDDLKTYIADPFVDFFWTTPGQWWDRVLWDPIRRAFAYEPVPARPSTAIDFMRDVAEGGDQFTSAAGGGQAGSLAGAALLTEGIEGGRSW